MRSISPIIRQVGTVSATLLVLICLTTKTAGRSESVSIQKAFNEATAVVVVQIEDQEVLREQGKTCGIRHTASVVATFKGTFEPNRDEVTFGRDDGLVRGKRYLMFLNYIADPLTQYEALIKQRDLPDAAKPEEMDDIIRKIKCEKIIPGFVFDARVAWEVKLGYVIALGLRPDLPRSIRLSSPEFLLWLINKDDLFSYLRSISGQ